ncbi:MULTISPECIES: hypothetical protein [Rhizobium]|nr:hypothetical protein [Rhizobium aegyptiacum]
MAITADIKSRLGEMIYGAIRMLDIAASINASIAFALLIVTDRSHERCGGWARVIGHNSIFVDDRDPLAHGFQIR